MAKNKQQMAADLRSKAAVPAAPVAEQPKENGKATPAVVAAAAAAGPSKQDMTIAKLREGWTAKGVDLSKMTVKDDGKFKVVVVAEGWPRVTIGPTGGVVVTDLKSYAKAFDAAMIGKELFEKQQAREAKKATATAPAVAKSEPAAAPVPVKTKAA